MSTYLLHMKNGDVFACDDYIKLRDFWIANAGEGMGHIEVLTSTEKTQLCQTPSQSGERGSTLSAPTPTLRQSLTTIV